MASSFKMYIPSFSKKLAAINIDQLLLAPYPRTYLQLLLHHHMYYLHIYVQVLDRFVENTNIPKVNVSLIDYGAGNGLLGLFAKHCGVGAVYLTDHSAVFIDAAKQLAVALDISIDGFINGDWDDVAVFFKERSKPDAVVGTDVIEHIYDLESFFARMRLLNESMVTVFTTASVTNNPFKTKQLMRLQHHDELIASNAEHAMPGDAYAGLPFLEIRKRIIQQHQPQLSNQEANKLAIGTRGMSRKDILTTVDQYVRDQSLPATIIHPTNTCDPITGSWTERLLKPGEYEEIYQKTGFSLSVFNGFYNQWQGGLKSIALKILNKIIALPGRQGNLITPYIMLVGKKK